MLLKTYEKIEQLPIKIRGQLPDVKNKSLYALLNENEFVNSNDLLPNNHTPSSAAGDRMIVQDELSEKLKVKSEEGTKDVMGSFGHG